jgi:anti-repressor protein
LSTIIPQPDEPSNIFDVLGNSIRFGLTADDVAYAVASDYAKAMGYRDAANALRLLDEDEKGTQIVSTPGGPQQMGVIYEDGLWELIFRSTLPGAKVIKKRVKQILQEIRRTGRYEVAPVPRALSNRELALMVIAEADRADEAERRVAELEPVAQAYDVIASAKGDFSLRDSAFILNRDPGIKTGQNRLMDSLRDFNMVDAKDVPYAKHETHLTERVRTYTHHVTGEKTLAKRPQIRITVAGLRYLHKRLGGQAPLRFDHLPFAEGDAA